MNHTQIDAIEREWKKFERPDTKDTIPDGTYNAHDEFLAVSCFLDENGKECAERRQRKPQPENDCTH